MTLMEFMFILAKLRDWLKLLKENLDVSAHSAYGTYIYIYIYRYVAAL